MLEEILSIGACDRRIRLAVIDGLPDVCSAPLCDTGLEIAEDMVPDGLGEPDPHGTEICSLIFGRSPDHQGLAAGCSGLALPVFFKRRDGARTASQVAIAHAITVAVERGVQIINISAGQLVSSSEIGQHLENALRLCADMRVLVVAAAGNDGCDCFHVPAAVPSVLAVGAMDDLGRPLPSSNWGRPYQTNGLLAPGMALATTTVGGEPVRRSGTSFAAALVSALAGRLLSICRSSGYNLDAIDVRDILLSGCDKCDRTIADDCDFILAGRLNAATALQRLHEAGARRSGSGGALAPAARGPIFKPSGEGKSMDTDMLMPAGANPQRPINLVQSAVLPQQDFGLTPIGAEAAQSACSCGCGGKGQDDHEHAKQSDCGCGCGGKGVKAEGGPGSPAGAGCGTREPPKLVYVIGSLWFDFGSEARYDAIVQRMGDAVAANNPVSLFAFLKENIEYATGITFIIMQDQIPIYALQPAGPFALRAYQAILDALESCLMDTGVLQRVAIPGVATGTTRLMNGMTLPVVYPDIRGMVKWDLPQLVASVKAAVNAEALDDDYIFNFLIRVYDELRNFGMTAGERALNFAATNAFQAASAFVDAAGRQLELHGIKVVKSQICRPDSDCWDIQLLMFDPEDVRRSGRVYRFTVDVSEILPVTIGTIRTYAVPLSALG
jgi:cyanobactin maturation PatA/PatG family protease